MITLIKKLYQFGQNYLFAHQMKKIKLFLFFTLKEEQKHYTMIHIEMYRITGRSFLKNNYLSSFIQFESCCGVCWCCKRLKKILDEFEKKKGFNMFNSHIQCWKIYQNLNNFEIMPIFENDF